MEEAHWLVANAVDRKKWLLQRTIVDQFATLSYQEQIELTSVLVQNVRGSYRKIWQAKVDVLSEERKKQNTLPVIPGFEYELDMTRNCKLFDPLQPVEEQYITLQWYPWYKWLKTLQNFLTLQRDITKPDDSMMRRDWLDNELTVKNLHLPSYKLLYQLLEAGEPQFTNNRVYMTTNLVESEGMFSALLYSEGEGLSTIYEPRITSPVFKPKENSWADRQLTGNTGYMSIIWVLPIPQINNPPFTPPV